MPANGLVLIDALREATRDLHVRAERSGIIARLLAGHARRQDYAMLLRNLLPAYRAMERRLSGVPLQHAVVRIRDGRLFRAPAIEADLRAIYGCTWHELPLVPAARRYADRLESLPGCDSHRLAAHCYTRYLGDLSGGQILQRLLQKTLKLPQGALTCYRFDLPGSVSAFKADYIAKLNATAGCRRELDQIVDEARTAFKLNIAVSNQVLEQSAQSESSVSGWAGTS